MNLANAPASAVAANQLARIESDVLECEQLYETGRRVHSFWGISDLRGSARYRILAGDENSYVRAEVFVRALRRLYGAYSDATVMKELGDALLVRSEGLRALLEVACVYDAVARLWTVSRERDEDISLKAKFAIGFGDATQLARNNAIDFIGKPLDRLARISSEEADESVVFLLDDSAYEQGAELVSEYPFLHADGPLTLPSSKLKPGEPPVRYWKVVIDRPAFGQFRARFAMLRNTAHSD